MASVVVARATDPTCPDVVAPALSFGEKVVIDPNRAGGEPVSVVAQDGSIIVSAHAGTTHLFRNPEALAGATDFAVGYANQTLNWRSSDGGATWKYVGTAGLRAGPHSPTSTGFSDPDLAMDAGGRIYNVEIDLANVAVYSSIDDGKSWPFANPVSSAGDRPWLMGGDPDEVFLYVNLPRQLWRSTTGGLTFEPLDEPPFEGKMINDPLNPTDGIIGPTDDGFALSGDDGRTWEVFDGAGLGPATRFFGTLAADRAGWVYTSAAGGYRGAGDTTPDGIVTFNYFNRSTLSWGDRVVIPAPGGSALWSWIVAGDDGRVAVAWLQNLSSSPTEFHVYVAETLNGHGTTVTCSDGSTRFVPPQFAVADAGPVHVGHICLQGTACNLVPNAAAADRRLGDFITINFDHEGRIFVVSGDTTLRNSVGGPKPVANPVFLKQSAGEPLLAEPDEVRESRCLFPLPVC